MTCYEVLPTVISILSLFATIFFGIAVLLLSKKANEIAKEAIKVQQEIFISQVTKVEDDIKEIFSGENSENINDLIKAIKELQTIFAYHLIVKN